MAQPTTGKTPQQKGVRTFLQTVAGSLVGLVLAVWNVPGVPDAVVAYAKTNFAPLLVTLAALVGVPAGLIAYVQNKKGL